MGTYFTKGANKAAIVAECIESWETDACRATCLQHCVRGECLWSVWRYFDKAANAAETIIKLDLLQSDPYGWGYKPMDESVHPYYYSCPLSYLEMAPPVNEQWRANVRAFHKSPLVPVESYP